VPVSAAIFWLIASARIVPVPLAGFVSPVAIAVIAAAFVSAMNRIPSGPKASWLIALNSGLPSCMPAVRPALARRFHTPRCANIDPRRTVSRRFSHQVGAHALPAHLRLRFPR
jgi:hypothetical protein